MKRFIVVVALLGVTASYAQAQVPEIPFDGNVNFLKLPPDMNKPHKWKVKFQGPAAQIHKKTNFYYPEVLPPCHNTVAAR